jgi:hypothetical protein
MNANKAVGGHFEFARLSARMRGLMEKTATHIALKEMETFFSASG